MAVNGDKTKKGECVGMIFHLDWFDVWFDASISMQGLQECYTEACYHIGLDCWSIELILNTQINWEIILREYAKEGQIQ